MRREGANTYSTLWRHLNKAIVCTDGSNRMQRKTSARWDPHQSHDCADLIQSFNPWHESQLYPSQFLQSQSVSFQYERQHWHRKDFYKAYFQSISLSMVVWFIKIMYQASLKKMRLEFDHRLNGIWFYKMSWSLKKSFHSPVVLNRLCENGDASHYSLLCFRHLPNVIFEQQVKPECKEHGIKTKHK